MSFPATRGSLCAGRYLSNPAKVSTSEPDAGEKKTYASKTREWPQGTPLATKSPQNYIEAMLQPSNAEKWDQAFLEEYLGFKERRLSIVW